MRQNCKHCFIIILHCSSLIKDRPCRTQRCFYGLMWKNESYFSQLEYINHFSLTLPFRLNSRRSQKPHDVPHAFLWETISELLCAPHGGVGGVICQRQIPSGALLDLRVSFTVLEKHFPELHSVKASRGGKKKRRRRGASRLHSAAPASNLCWGSPQ